MRGLQRERQKNTHTHTRTHAETHIDRQTDRQTDTHTQTNSITASRLTHKAYTTYVYTTKTKWVRGLFCVHEGTHKMSAKLKGTTGAILKISQYNSEKQVVYTKYLDLCKLCEKMWRLSVQAPHT